MKVINLYAGPGTGKSTTAADLFALMKWNNINVELVSEYAKKITWEGHHNILQDQLYLLAKQNRSLERLRGKVDFVITDSPLMLCTVYAGDDYLPSYKKLVREVYDSYDNINVFMYRLKPYHQIGRSQNEEQAREVDTKILKMLSDESISFHTVDANPDAKNKILELVRE